MDLSKIAARMALLIQEKAPQSKCPECWAEHPVEGAKKKCELCRAIFLARMRDKKHPRDWYQRWDKQPQDV